MARSRLGGTVLDAWLVEWLNLLLRWAHLVIGAAWIGASFYFNWLNNHVRATMDPAVSERVAGELWAVHGGAFYRVQKYGGAPEQLPGTLHWFKYEAYFTWVTGICLLGFTYWLNADAMMVDRQVAQLSPTLAITIGVACIVGGWLVYDMLCRSPLARTPAALTGVLAVGTVAAAMALTQLLTARAAYIHLGAMLGTIMAANVFFVIIPGQRAMVDAMSAGRPPDVSRGAAGSLRSLHNNYFTFPVLFIMVSNHYPVTWGDGWSWAILAGISASAVAIRHWQNLRGRGVVANWLLPLGALGIVGTALVTWPTPRPVAADGSAAVPFSRVQTIVATRCLPCHASEPWQPGIAVPPKGMVFDMPDDIRRHAAVIRQQAVDSQVMPLGNLTQMTDEERALLGRWIAALP